MIRINADLLLASGAMQGPYRKTRPLTLSWHQRIRRVLAKVLRDLKLNKGIKL
jgi:hypothetical protein